MLEPLVSLDLSCVSLLKVSELGGADTIWAKLTISALATAEPPVGKADESCPADATRELLLLSRSRTPRTPAEPMKLL